MSQEQIKEIVKNAPKDNELTSERTAYFFKIAKEKIDEEKAKILGGREVREAL